MNFTRKLLIRILPVLALLTAPGTAWAQLAGDKPSIELLARNLRALARSPADVGLLIATGRAALQLGDAGAAAGFFRRAGELAPANAAAHAGMGSALVALNQPAAALAEFSAARRLGVPAALIAPDLGLAYDLAGNQREAQATYEAAKGAESGEAKRRLAISLAITGDQSRALEALQPLVVSHDGSAVRARALVLALGGDIAGSTSALDAIIAGSGSRAEPFLRALASLTAGEKAAALDLGTFPARFSGGPFGPSSSEARPPKAIKIAPMEYGGTAKVPSLASPQQARARLALYGVFTGP